MAAYRVPRHPKVEVHARRQTRIARLVGLALIWVLLGTLVVVAERVIPSQHLPWRPLSVIDPLGAATMAKAARTGANPAACRAVLRQGGLFYVNAPPAVAGDACAIPDGLTLTGGMAPLMPVDTVMTCKQALAVSIWERQVVQPVAFETLGQAVVGVEHFGSFACRRIYGREDGPLSQHASANALDVSGFRLADGSEISVVRDWTDPGPKGQFLRRIRDGGCRVFVTVLSPDYNAEHANHFHLDMGGWPLCA